MTVTTDLDIRYRYRATGQYCIFGQLHVLLCSPGGALLSGSVRVHSPGVRVPILEYMYLQVYELIESSVLPAIKLISQSPVALRVSDCVKQVKSKC